MKVNVDAEVVWHANFEYENFFALFPGYLVRYIFAFATDNFILAQSTRKEKQEAKENRIKKLIEAENYVFIAQMALPMSGGNRHLTPEYEVEVSKDTINSYLPFFGRAYSASMNPDDAGIKFISKDFTYNVTTGKKGWNISIRPNDVRGVELFTFFISEDGYASLQVTQTERQVISFNGYITGKNKKWMNGNS